MAEWNLESSLSAINANAHQGKQGQSMEKMEMMT
jgi:hypothetical protein